MVDAQSAPFEIMHGETRLCGFAASPAGEGPHPAVLMFPGATGAGASFRKTVQELADLGYLAVGIDMYGVGADISTTQAAGVHFEALLHAPQHLRSRVVAWFDAVCARADVDATRVAAIGYCFGGKCVLELARSGAPVRSVTSFHGLLKTHEPAQAGAFTGHAAIWTGGRDPYVPLEDLATLRDEFDAADIDYQATLFARAQHSFTDPDNDGVAPGIAYDRLAHRTVWVATLALLEHVLA
jgi:dienelactone hydrolase